MDNTWARRALDAPAPDASDAAFSTHPPDTGGHTDDPLGDEAAFPSTWQQLDSLEAALRD